MTAAALSHLSVLDTLVLHVHHIQHTKTGILKIHTHTNREVTEQPKTGRPTFTNRQKHTWWRRHHCHPTRWCLKMSWALICREARPAAAKNRKHQGGGEPFVLRLTSAYYTHTLELATMCVRDSNFSCVCVCVICLWWFTGQTVPKMLLLLLAMLLLLP